MNAKKKKMERMSTMKKRFFIGYDAKKKKVYAVTFIADDFDLPKKMEMFKASNLSAIEVENNRNNIAALQKLLDAMKRHI
jgi:hypothetical protein